MVPGAPIHLRAHFRLQKLAWASPKVRALLRLLWQEQPRQGTASFINLRPQLEKLAAAAGRLSILVSWLGMWGCIPFLEVLPGYL